MKLDIGGLFKKYKPGDEAQKALVWLGALIMGVVVMAWGVPELIVFMWNNFVCTVFPLHAFNYINGLAAMFFTLFVVGVFILLKEVE